MERIIGVIGLGYVGLPLALSFAKKAKTVGFDINVERVKALCNGIDVTNEGYERELETTSLEMTHEVKDLKKCNFYIVGVPTPVDENNNPDFRPLHSACDLVGKVLKKGDIVVFESTVYPGVTEEICGPRLSEVSGLKMCEDFALGYSPERINPGDAEHSLAKVVKVVSAQDQATLNVVADVYSLVVEAGVHRAPSIKVAEAAKVIENTQRDLNIALMNELAVIFDKIGIATRDVLEAAATKWNFVKFTPGLVGGHCIGVDPYYLTTKAEQLKYNPQVILAGRRINDGMGAYIAQRLIKLMVNTGVSAKDAKVGILGITFKENVADIRNSRVPDIVAELKQFGIDPLIFDPLADNAATFHEYGLNLSDWDKLKDLDALIYAVSHRKFKSIPSAELFERIKKPGIMLDIKSALDRSEVPKGITYWSL